MVTAWMGQGNDSEAIATCRLLTGRGDPELRQQAKQLLTILEAPSLDRPESWSMRMPQLELNRPPAAAPAPPCGGDAGAAHRHHHPQGRPVRQQPVSPHS